MARPGGEQTRARIRQAVRDILTTEGFAGFSLDAVAARVGVTRQAVLYHFKSRERLLADAYLELLAAEADAMVEAADRSEAGLAGVTGFLSRALDWHLEDASRFRLLYAVVQTEAMLPTLDPATRRERVYAATGRMYSALQARLSGDGLPPGVDARKLGIALHVFVLGMACYEGLLRASGETFAHDWHDIADTLSRALGAGARRGAP